jgi:hypothetical protein
MFFIVRGSSFGWYLILKYSQKELTHTILLHPSYFGPRMLQFLESKLYADVEGTCSGQFGYIIAVVSRSDIGKGMVLSGSGQAEFVTKYRAIVFKPFKGEVVDGIVATVTRVRCTLLHPESVAYCGVDGLFRGRGAAESLRFESGTCGHPSHADVRTDFLVAPAHPSRLALRS